MFFSMKNENKTNHLHTIFFVAVSLSSKVNILQKPLFGVLHGLPKNVTIVFYGKILNER